MSQFPLLTRPFIRAASLAVAWSFLSLSGIAYAEEGARTNDDDPNVNAHGLVVNNILTILRSSPDSASDACLKSLTDMHKVQEQLDKEETAQQSSDLGLVRDVLESDMEGVIRHCGADAQKICQSGEESPSAKTKAFCAHLPDIDSGEDSDDLQ